MLIRNHPFVSAAFGSPSPGLPVTLINPLNGFDFSTWALIDTGADSIVIPGRIANALYCDEPTDEDEWYPCEGIGGETELYYHPFRLNIMTCDSDGNVKDKPVMKISKRLYAISPSLEVMVLGVDDFLRNYKLSVDYPNKVFSLTRPRKKSN